MVVLHLYLMTTGCDRLEPLRKLGCNVQAMAPKTFPVADLVAEWATCFPIGEKEARCMHGSTMFSHPLSSYMLVMIHCSLAKNMQAKHFVIVPEGAVHSQAELEESEMSDEALRSNLEILKVCLGSLV